MKVRVKYRSVWTALLSALCVVITAIIAVGVLTTPRMAASADETEDTAHGYYYSQLRNSRLAERLYNALWDMNEEGLFEACTEEYDLTSVLTQKELADYIINKSPAIPVALGAARDAFYLDHPELFYVDVHKMRLTFSSDGNTHVAYLGAGREATYYADYTATSKAEVKAAVADFNTQVGAVVAAAKAKSNVVEQIQYVNEYLCDNAKYDFGAYDDVHSDRAYNGYVYTAYGILNSGEGKALCEGYSKAFKVIMDKLGIPCALVAGPACSGLGGVDGQGNKLESTYEPHMWNAVKVDGQWYGVDVTWNDTENNHGKYLLLGEDSLMKSRYEDPVISSSEFKVRYPVLRMLDYGEFADSNGFEFKDSGTVGGVELGYEASGLVGVSYEGKNINQLKADGKYLAVRLGDDQPWVDYTAFIDFLSNNTDGEIIVDKYTLFMPYMADEYSQFAIINVAPDDTINLGSLTAATWKNLDTGNILAVSAKYNNQDFGMAKGRPNIKSMTPNVPGYIMSLEPVDISITYDEKLVYEDPTTTEVGIEITAERSTIRAKAENVKWHEDTNTVTFTFRPSLMYSDNCLSYYVAPTNLIGKDTGERPEAGRFAFKRISNEVICPKVFNDGRLYTKLYGAPKFVSASDESLNEFKDKDGNPIVNQRSQLMLVINRPTKAENEQMEEAAKTLGDHILASETYQIDLQICGCLQKVPDGSYMQVGFGFPDGIGPEDAGVSFTVYHYKKNDDGTIKEVEAVPCVINEYGIIATVKSFSPFMICAVTSDSPSVKNLDKRVLASVDGIGGNIDKKDILSVASGGSVTYTITEDEGYTLDRVLVNGVDQKASVVDGKLTLHEADLKANNSVVVTFISDRAAKFIADNNLHVVEHNLIVTDKDMIVAYVEEDLAPAAPKKNNTGLIVGIVIAVIVVLAGVGVAVYFILRKKGGDKKATDGKGNKKPEQKKASAQTENGSATASSATRRTTAAQRPSSASASRTASTTPTRPQSSAPQRQATTARPSSTPARPAQQRSQSGTTRNASTDKNKSK